MHPCTYHTHGTTLPYMAAVINLWPTLFTTGLIAYLGYEYSANWGGSERVSGIVCIRDSVSAQSMITEHACK